MAKPLVAIFIPGGLFFLAAVVLAGSGLATAAPVLTGILPYGIWTVGILLAWRFNRTRLVFGLFTLGMAERALWYLATDADTSTLVPEMAAVLVPLNLVIIFLFRERGAVFGRGGWRFLILCCQPLIAGFLLQVYPGEIAGWLHFPLLPFAALNQAPLPQPALLAFGGALLFFGLMLLVRRGALENGFFWATVAATGALVVSPGPLSTLYLGVAGVILIVAVIEAAHGMAFRDDLTGLPSRRALEDGLSRLGTKYAVAMVDIDFFKKFNDRFGHEVGDQVLCMVAAKLSRISGGGKPYRYGGEEFTIIFPGKSASEALPHLEKLREIIAAGDFIIRGKNRPRVKPGKDNAVKGSARKAAVTVSIGLAAGNTRAHAAREVLKAADQALYRAKKNGRNQVVAG